MSKSWSDILDYYRQRRASVPVSPFHGALGGIEQLAAYIEGSPLKSGLFGWTSMFDLCIQQGDHEPYSGPYLRISPLHSGDVEFRYVDTFVKNRQWYRQVPSEVTVERLIGFLDQLHWVSKLSDFRTTYRFSLLNEMQQIGCIEYGEFGDDKSALLRARELLDDFDKVTIYQGLRIVGLIVHPKHEIRA